MHVCAVLITKTIKEQPQTKLMFFVFIYFHLPVVALVILYYPSDQSIVGNIVYRP